MIYNDCKRVQGAMKLERIKIEGYKSIRELDLELRPLNVLIGANGAGKSNFISAFQMLHEMLNERLQIYIGRNGGAELLLHFGSNQTKTIRFELQFSSGETIESYEVSWAPTSNDTLVFSSDRSWSQHSTDSTRNQLFDFGSGHKETVLFKQLPIVPHAKDGRIRSLPGFIFPITEPLNSFRIYHFHDTSPDAGVKKTGDVDDNKFLRSDASNLAAFLYRLKQTQPEYYRRIVKTIRLAAPFFDDFDLEPSRLNADKIRLEWHEYGWDTYLNANVLSDGTLRFICLCTLLLQPELPSVILIDEPELGLHPYAITLLADMLISAAKQTQVIITTQSVPLINQFTPEDVVVVDRKNHQSTFTRVNSEELAEWLEEYTLGELWEKNIIGGRPRNPEYPA
jgi:predicted ATPase